MKKQLFMLTAIFVLSTSVMGGCGKKEQDTQRDSTQVAELEEKTEVGPVVDVLFDWQEDEENNPYAIITAVDEDGNEVWKYTTETTEIAEKLSTIGEIVGNYYCYSDGSITMALNLSDGTPAWILKKIRGDGVLAALDEKGNQLWSYNTQEKEVDPIGILGNCFYYLENDTIVALNRLDGTLAWKNHDFGNNSGDIKTAIGTDGTLYISTSDVALFAVDKQGKTLEKIDRFDDEYLWTSEMVCYDDYIEITRLNISLVPDGSLVYRVDLNDFSYEISQPDNRVSNEKLTVYTTGQVSDVQFESEYTTEENDEYGVVTSGEYGVFTAVDNVGNMIWQYTTDTFVPTELSAVCPIGIKGSQYYLSAGGTIIALNLSDGSKLWENDECGAYSVSSAIGEDGTIYLCGYYHIDFMAIDSNGNTLKLIDTFDPNYYWPYKVEYFGQYVEVTFDADNENHDSGGGVFRVYLDDFSYELVKYIG